jgi:hypothetical protein
MTPVSKEIVELLSQVIAGEVLILNWDESGNWYLDKLTKKEASQQAKSWNKGIIIETWLFRRIF